MLRYPGLLAAARRAPTISVDGTWSRCVRADIYRDFFAGTSSARPLWGLGAPVTGARFTPVRGAAALYLAMDMETALREQGQFGPAAAAVPRPGDARAIYAVEVTGARAIDLTALAVRRVFGTDVHELASAWRFRRDRRRPPTQLLGAAVAAAGVEGLVYSSTKRRGGRCLVLFLPNLRKGTTVTVRDGATVLERIAGKA